MSVCYSPLRYPGGKQILAQVISHLIRLNGAADGTYVEPYAGGAGAALALLFGEHVHRIVINDADKGVFAMWWSLLNRTDEFLTLLRKTPITVKERDRQRRIYLERGRTTRVRLGFSTFYLNRVHRSGIIANGGPIGGRSQEGQWGLDARFNKEDLEKKILRVVDYKSRIEVTNLDGIDLLRAVVEPRAKKEPFFVYLDPPYYVKGARLYLNSYQHEDHEDLRDYLKTARFPWVLSYDNVTEIRELYRGFRQMTFNLAHRAGERKEGQEVMIASKDFAVPLAWARTIDSKYLSTQIKPMVMPFRLTSRR